MNLEDDFSDEMESAAQGKTASKRDVTIAAQTTSIEKLKKSIKKVDLINTLQVDLADPLHKYKDDDGNLNKYKIPQNLYIVAIIFEVIKAAKKLNLGICVKHGVIYIFNGKYWEEVEDESVKQILSQSAIKLGYHSPAGARVSDFRDKLFKQFLSDGIEEAVAPRRDKILINLSNGTLEISKDNVALRDHHRDDFLTYMLHYPYDKEAVSPIFDTFIKKVLPDFDTRSVLQEFLGYVFTTELKLEKGAVLYGGGSNGKSVFFEVVSALMGTENLSFKGLGDLCMKGDKGNNHRAEIENKLINYASEISPKGADIEIFKALISGEPVSARRLYKDVYTFRNSAKLIFNANKLPGETERTHGFFRRYMIIPFDVTISEEEKDVDLHTKITSKELSGVLNWTILGLKRLLTNRKFTKSSKVDEALESFKKESNSVLLFIEEYEIIKNDYEFISNKDLYRSYTEFSNGNGYMRFSQNNFSKEMVSAGFESIRKKIAGHTQRGFKAEFSG